MTPNRIFVPFACIYGTQGGLAADGVITTLPLLSSGIETMRRLPGIRRCQ